jgi:flagellar protein FliO/FliZ
MDWADYLRFVFALIFVLGLMGGFWLLLKKLGFSQNITLGASANRRLTITEILPLDPRRKAVLIKRDDTEHLVILSPTGETVVETNIRKESSESSNT